MYSLIAESPASFVAARGATTNNVWNKITPTTACLLLAFCTVAPPTKMAATAYRPTFDCCCTVLNVPKFCKKIDIDIMDPVMPSEEQSVESLRDKIAALIEKRLKK